MLEYYICYSLPILFADIYNQCSLFFGARAEAFHIFIGVNNYNFYRGRFVDKLLYIQVS